MVSRCPNCGFMCSIYEHFKCPKCNEKFWNSKEDFERNRDRMLLTNENIREREEQGEKSQFRSSYSPPASNSPGFFGKLLGIAFFMIFLFFVFVYKPLSVCEQTIKYRISDIDPRFGISVDEVSKLMGGVEYVWEDQVQFNLFEQDPTAPFVVDFVFDERQEKTNKAGEIENTIDKIDASIGDLNSEYDSLLFTYNQRSDSYDMQLNSYNSRMDQLNADVAYWNNQGGAPDNVYNEIVSEENSLKFEASRLNEQLSELKALESEVNSLAAASNSFSENYNKNIDDYNELVGDGRPFDQGAYVEDESGKRIEVYEFSNLVDLKILLAHEFGHALTLDHVANPKSIMYYLMKDQNPILLTLTAEDIAALDLICND